MVWVPSGPSPRSASPSSVPQRPKEGTAQRTIKRERPMEKATLGEELPADYERIAEATPNRIRLQEAREALGNCQRCGLAGGRKNIVFGQGNPDAELLFVGEAPGQDEDVAGEAFVGAAGQLLTRMIEAMGLAREDVYIANIIKCRPPQNRNPAADEIAACEPFLSRQIEAIAPRIIVALGNVAAQTLLRTETGITKLRGRFFTYQGIPLMPTFHPAYLLRNLDSKRAAWQDLKAVMAEMDRLSIRRRR